MVDRGDLEAFLVLLVMIRAMDREVLDEINKPSVKTD
jgi:hypothetical protein